MAQPWNPGQPPTHFRVLTAMPIRLGPSGTAARPSTLVGVELNDGREVQLVVDTPAYDEAATIAAVRAHVAAQPWLGKDWKLTP